MTEGDEVLIAVMPLLASELLVVNLKARHRPTSLAAPMVALKDAPA
jgi:hypothetical protein